MKPYVYCVSLGILPKLKYLPSEYVYIYIYILHIHTHLSLYTYIYIYMYIYILCVYIYIYIIVIIIIIISIGAPRGGLPAPVVEHLAVVSRACGEHNYMISFLFYLFHEFHYFYVSSILSKSTDNI